MARFSTGAKSISGFDAKKLLKQVKASVEPAAKNGAESVEAELLAHAIRYYQAWDEEPLVPYHRVNSI